MNVSSPQYPSFTPSSLGLTQLRAQKVLGWLAMLFMLAAFASLVDGLTAEMQRGPNRLDVMAASETPLSGPIPVKKAELDDFYVQGNAPDGQVRLVLDDFFASYWFGSGMWRGRLVVGDNPGIGEYHMVVAFRDAPPKGAQNYRVVVWADEASMRQGSYSWVTRTLGYSPFATAAYIAPMGLLLCIVNFLLGRQRANRLQAAGCGEVYKVMRGEGGSEKAKAIGAGRQEVSFSLGEIHGMALGQRCLIMRPDGSPLMEATVVFCDARHSSFLLNSDEGVRAGDVVFPLQPGMQTPLSSLSTSTSQNRNADGEGAFCSSEGKEKAGAAPLGGVPLSPFRPATKGTVPPAGQETQGVKKPLEPTDTPSS